MRHFGSISLCDAKICTSGGTMNLPAAAGDLLTATSESSLTNKTISDSTCYIANVADATKKMKFDASTITTETTRTYQLPDNDGKIALIADLKDNELKFTDNADPTKILEFQLSGITTETSRIATWPDSDITVVGTANAQTLTNKELTAPTISNP